MSALAPPETLTSVVGGPGFLYAAIALVIVTALASWRLAVYQVRAAE